MNLSSPITITPPAITRADGTVKTFNPITIDELDITITDNAKRKIAVAHIKPAPRPMLLWEKEAYDLAGDYTQEMVETKVLELLGSDPKTVLEGLFMPLRPGR